MSDRQRLSARTYVLAVAAFGALIALFASLVWWQVARLERAHGDQLAGHVARMLATQTNERLASVDDMLQRVANHFNARERRDGGDSGDSGGEFAAFLAGQRAAVDGIGALRVLDADGTERFAPGTPARPQADDQALLRLAREDVGKGLLGLDPVLVDAADAKRMLVLARRLVHADGSFAGVVVADLATQAFGRLFSRSELGHQGTILVLGADRTWVYRYPELGGANAGIGSRSLPPVLREAMDAGTPAGRYRAPSPFDQVERDYVFQRLADYPLYLVLGWGQGALGVDWQTPAMALALLGAVMVLGFIWGARRHYLGARQAQSQHGQQNVDTLMQASPVPMLRVGADGLVANANVEAGRLLGYELPTLQGMAVEQLMPLRFRGAHPAHRDVFMQQGVARPMGVANQGMEFFALHRSGAEIAVRVMLSPLDVDGARQVLVALYDESESRRARKSMRDALSLTSTLIDSAGLAIIATDASGVVTVFNPAAELLLGYEGKETIGRLKLTDFHDADALQTLARAGGHDAQTGSLGVLVQAARDGLVKSFRFTMRRKSGAAVPVSVLLTVLRDEDGAVDGYLSLVEDISERLARERALDQVRVRLQLATDAAGVGIWSWNFDNDTLDWDARICDWYEVPPGQRQVGLYYDFWRSRVHPDDIARAELALAAVRRDGVGYDEITRIVLPDGRVRHIHAAAVLQYDEAGRQIGMVGINRDITQQRELEARLVAAKNAAEVANRAKTEFLANMSHELRTPMNAVLGLSSLLLDTELSARQRGYLNDILGAGTALLGMLGQMIDYASIDAGVMRLEAQALSVAGLMEKCRALFVAKANEKGLALNFQVAPEVPQVLLGDSLRLLQVLNNLVDNAVKFTPHGEIKVSVGVVAQVGQEFALKFQVQDSGIGMTAQQCSDAFTLFHQSDASSTRQHGGIGMGLSLSKRLVDMMGGEIGVQSEPGGGSKFWWTVRLGLPEPAAHASVDDACLAPLDAPLPPAAGMPALDLQLASAATGHDPALLRQVLQSFHADFVQAPQQLARDIEAGRLDAAKRLVHTVKGLAPTLGAISLHRQAQAFERGLLGGDLSLQEAFCSALREVLSSIAAHLSDADAQAPAAADSAQRDVDLALLLPQLQALVQMLESGQSRARSASTDIGRLLEGSDLQAMYEPVARLIARFDFEAGLQQLRTLADRQHWNL